MNRALTATLAACRLAALVVFMTAHVSLAQTERVQLTLLSSSELQPGLNYMRADGSLVFASDTEGNSITITDFGDPLHPRLLSALSLGGMQALEVGSGLVFVAAASQVHIFDVRDPAAPAPQAIYTDVGSPGDIIALRLLGGTLFALRRMPGGESESIIDAIDVSDPGHPARVGTYRIPDGVTYITAGSFLGCARLTDVTIPSSVTTVEPGSLDDCTGLVSITVDASNAVFRSLDGALFDKGQTILIKFPKSRAGAYTAPDSVRSIQRGAFSGCASLTSVTIPNSVTNVGDYAFADCLRLTDVSIGNSVRAIGEGVFSGCRTLTNLMISDTVTSIGGGAFSDCRSLTQVTIGGRVTSIGSWTFSGCTSLPHITIPNSVTSIGDHAFYGCSKLTYIVIPNGVSSIGNGALSGCSSLTNITMPDTVTTIGRNAFSGCSRLTDITPPNSVTNIGAWAFSDCTKLIRVTIPNPVRLIEDGLFYGCTSLPSIVIPKSATNIGNSAFARCTSLTKITLPDSVTSIGNEAFYGCALLTGLYFQGSAPSLRDSFARISDGQGTAYYLPGATGWGSIYGGLRTALWLPEIQTSDTTFGVQSNRFGFSIWWASDRVVVVEATTSLSSPDWSPVATNTLVDGRSDFSDADWAKHPHRFYRVRSR